MAAVIVAAALSACAPNSPDSTASTPISAFSCCEQADIDTVRHAGETFDGHWTINSEPVATTVAAGPVTLSVSLSEGYRDVSELKATESDTPTQLVRSRDVMASTSTSTAPISVITIPVGAPPGYYNLTTTVTTGRARPSGSAIIRVEGR